MIMDTHSRIDTLRSVGISCEICHYAFMSDIFYCEQCTQALCDSCVQLHNNFKLLQGHTISAVNDVSERNSDLDVSERHSRKRTDYDYVTIKYNFEKFKMVNNTATYVEECEQCSLGNKDVTGTTNSLYDYVLKDEDVCSKLQEHWLTDKSAVQTRVWRQDNVDQSEHKITPVNGVNDDGIGDIKDKKANRRAVRYSYEETDIDTVVSPLVTSTGSKFAVTVQNTPLAVKGKLVGDRNLTIEADKVVIQDMDTNESVKVFPFSWIRNFGRKGLHLFYFDVGKQCDFGEGTIYIVNHPESSLNCKQIYDLLVARMRTQCGTLTTLTTQ